MKKTMLFLFLSFFSPYFWAQDNIIGGAHEHLNTLFTLEDYKEALTETAKKQRGTILPMQFHQNTGGGRKADNSGKIPYTDPLFVDAFYYNFLHNYFNSTAFKSTEPLPFLTEKTSLDKVFKAGLKRESSFAKIYLNTAKTKTMADIFKNTQLLLQQGDAKEEIPKKIYNLEAVIDGFFLNAERLRKNFAKDSVTNSDLYIWAAHLSGKLLHSYYAYLKGLRLDDNKIWEPLVNSLSKKAKAHGVQRIVVTVPAINKNHYLKSLYKLLKTKARITLLLNISRGDFNKTSLTKLQGDASLQFLSGIDITGSLNSNFSASEQPAYIALGDLLKRLSLKRVNRKRWNLQHSNDRTTLKKVDTLAKELKSLEARHTEMTGKLSTSARKIKSKLETTIAKTKASLARAKTKASLANARIADRLAKDPKETDIITIRIHWLESNDSTFSENDSFIMKLITNITSNYKNDFSKVRIIIGHSFQITKLNETTSQKLMEFLKNILTDNNVHLEINLNYKSNMFLLANPTEREQPKETLYSKVHQLIKNLKEVPDSKVTLTQGSDGRSILDIKTLPYQQHSFSKHPRIKQPELKKELSDESTASSIGSFYSEPGNSSPGFESALGITHILKNETMVKLWQETLQKFITRHNTNKFINLFDRKNRSDITKLINKLKKTNPDGGGGESKDKDGIEHLVQEILKPVFLEEVLQIIENSRDRSKPLQGLLNDIIGIMKDQK